MLPRRDDLKIFKIEGNWIANGPGMTRGAALSWDVNGGLCEERATKQKDAQLYLRCTLPKTHALLEM